MIYLTWIECDKMKKIAGILIIILLSICLLKPKEKVKLDNVILKQEVNNKHLQCIKKKVKIIMF